MDFDVGRFCDGHYAHDARTERGKPFGAKGPCSTKYIELGIEGGRPAELACGGLVGV